MILRRGMCFILNLHIRYLEKGWFLVCPTFICSEQIFGYRNLNVNIWYLCGSLKTYINISYSSRIDTKHANGAAVSTHSSNVAASQADDILKLLSPAYSFDYDQNLVDFAEHFHVENFKPYGLLRHSYDCTRS